MSPPSLTAAGEPHPLPMERTSLTVSVAICASNQNRWPLSGDRCHHQSRLPIEIIICVDHDDSLLERCRRHRHAPLREEHSIGT